MRIDGLREIVALEMWCVSRSDRPRALAEWPTMLDIDKAHYYQLTDAALAAVAPAIEAAALERAAVVADQHILTGGLESWQARHIAACIRALKETT